MKKEYLEKVLIAGGITLLFGTMAIGLHRKADVPGYEIFCWFVTLLSGLCYLFFLVQDAVKRILESVENFLNRSMGGS